MIIQGLNVYQDGQFYALVTQQGIQIALLLAPNDGQIINDVGVLNIVCKAMAKRWGVSNKGSQQVS